MQFTVLIPTLASELYSSPEQMYPHFIPLANMKGGYILRDLASAVSAKHSWSTHNGYRWQRWQNNGFLEVSVVIMVKLHLFQGWALLREGKKMLSDLHRNSSLVIPAGEAGGNGGHGFRWAE